MSMELANVCRLFRSSDDLLLRICYASVSSDWAPLDQAHEHRNHGKHEQDVDEPAQGVRANHSQQPQNQEQGDDSPKHGVVLSDKQQRVDLQGTGYEGRGGGENPVKY
jgi:hypothetical protein